MSKPFAPAEVFAPGEILREELAARGWTQAGFAKVIGRPVQMVNEIIGGKKRITAESAKAFAAALGTSAEFWLNLDTTYQLATTPDADAAIALRAALLAR